MLIKAKNSPEISLEVSETPLNGAYRFALSETAWKKLANETLKNQNKGPAVIEVPDTDYNQIPKMGVIKDIIF